jgi:pilus assembly protein CpaD
VIIQFFKKDANMRSKMSLLLLASALGACGHTAQDLPDRGLLSVNVPVVERANYALDIAAPGGSLLQGEAERLQGWFQGLGLGYGDAVYVDGPYAESARASVSQVAARYGMLIQSGAPITAGAITDGSVRVIVSRARATVPNCPNWNVNQPNFNNRAHSNHGCATAMNYAALIGNPEDLIHGREGGMIDAETSSKAVGAYRSKSLSGASGAVSGQGSKGN